MTVTIAFIIEGESMSNVINNKYYILIVFMFIFEFLSIVAVYWLKRQLHAIFMKNTLSYNAKLLNFNVDILTIITLLLTAINGMLHSKNCHNISLFLHLLQFRNYYLIKNFKGQNDYGTP
ncbi:hypothetical protein ACR0RA_07820 [Staphylococcus epidermidis]